MYTIYDLRTYEAVYIAATYAAAWLIVTRNRNLFMYE